MCGCDRARGYQCDSCRKRHEMPLNPRVFKWDRTTSKSSEPMKPIAPADYIARIRAGTD